MSEQDGGHAFPCHPDTIIRNGMSLRDWFAGQALAGMYANEGYDGSPVDVIAVAAYKQADAMLAEREKQ